MAWIPPKDAIPISNGTDPTKKTTWAPPADAIPVDQVKKKEDTESAPDSNAGTPPPGTPDSSKPATPGTPPSVNQWDALGKAIEAGSPIGKAIYDAGRRVISGFTDDLPKTAKTVDLREEAQDFYGLFEHDKQSYGIAKEKELSPFIKEFKVWRNDNNEKLFDGFLFPTRRYTTKQEVDQFFTERHPNEFQSIKNKFDEKVIQRRLNLLSDISTQTKESQEKMAGAVQDYRDIKNLSDLGSYIGTMGGQAAYQIPLAVMTRGASSLLQESATIYDQQLDNLARAKGITREEVIRQKLDDPAAGQAYAVLAAGLDVVSAGNIIKAFRTAGGSMVKRWLKGAIPEAITEPAQGILEREGAKTGASTDQPAFDIPSLINEAAGGLIGGSVTIASPGKSPKQVAEEQKIAVDPNNPASIQQAAQTIQNTVNENARSEPQSQQTPVTQNVQGSSQQGSDASQQSAVPGSVSGGDESNIAHAASSGNNQIPITDAKEETTPEVAKEGETVTPPVTEPVQEVSPSTEPAATENVSKPVTDDAGTYDFSGVRQQFSKGQETPAERTEIETLREQILNSPDDLKWDGKNVTILTEKGQEMLQRYQELKQQRPEATAGEQPIPVTDEVTPTPVREEVEAPLSNAEQPATSDEAQAALPITDKTQTDDQNRQRQGLDIISERGIPTTNPQLDERLPDGPPHERQPGETATVANEQTLSPETQIQSEPSTSQDAGQYEFKRRGQSVTPAPTSSGDPNATGLQGDNQTSSDGKLYNNASIYTDESGQTQANVQPELTAKGKQYNVLSNELTTQEAKRIITSNPLNDVEATVFDESNDMDPTLRRATALELAKAQDKPADRQRIFQKYRELGTKAAQSVQVGNIAREDPAVQTMEIMAANEEANQKVLSQKDNNGKTVDQNLNATHSQLLELGKKYGVEVSESDTVDSVVRKIVSKSTPKPTTKQQAKQKLDAAADRLKKAWQSQQTMGAIFDPKNQAKKDVELTKALVEYIGALIEKIATESGEFVKNIGQQVADQTKKFTKEIGLEIHDDALAEIITPEIEAFQRATRYTPPITETEKNDAISSVLNVFLPINSTNKRGLSQKPAIQEFYQRLVQRLSAADPKFKKMKPVDALIEVSRNLDKYADVLQGVKDAMQGEGIDTSDITSVFDLPYFTKKIQQQVVIDDIKQLIRQQYTVQNQVAQSLADKLVNRYGLKDADAKAVEQIVHEEFAKRIKDASQRELTKLYGTSKLKKPRTAKSDADKIIDAMNMGAFSDDFYAGLVGAKFGLVNLSKQDIAMMQALAETVNSLPSGELRNKALTDFLTFTDGLADKNKAQAMWRNAMDLWYKSALSGFSTQARSLKGASLSSMMEVLPAVINNPVATFKGLGGLKALWNGVAAAGPKTWWHIFRTGMNTFGQDKPMPRSYWDKVTAKPYKELLADKQFLDAVNKTWVAPLNLMWRSMIATDAMFRYGMKGFEGYITEYNKLLADSGGKREADFWDNLNKRLVKDEASVEASKAQLEFEIQELRDRGVEIPVGYESRRLGEITDSKRNQDVVKFETEQANKAVMMNDPVGILGNVYRWMTQLGTPQDGDKKTELISRMIFRQFFPFMRVATNFLNRSTDFTPIGVVRGIRGGRSTREGWREMTPEERSRHFVKAAIGATLFTGLATALFDDDDEEGIILDPNAPIEITGLGLGAGKYQENKDLYVGRKDLSFRVKLPTGEWSGWYSYQDNPIGMILFPLGQASDDIRFTKFKETVKDEKDVKDVKERTIGTYMATGLHWGMSFASSLSYQQGMRNLMDVFGLSNRGNTYDEIIVKTATAPFKTVIEPNLYKQTYQQVKSILDVPEKKAYSIPDKLLKDIPLAEQIINTEEFDQLGYPVIHDFDWPLVPDIVLQTAKNNINYRQDKPEWQLVYKYPEVTLGERFKAPEQVETRGGVKKELTSDERNEFVRSAGMYLRGFMNESMDYLKTLDAQDLQTELNEYRSTAYKYAKQDVVGMSLMEEKTRMIDDLMRTTRLKKIKRNVDELKKEIKP